MKGQSESCIQELSKYVWNYAHCCSHCLQGPILVTPLKPKINLILNVDISKILNSYGGLFCLLNASTPTEKFAQCLTIMSLELNWPEPKT